MDIKINRNSGLIKLEVTLLDTEIESVANSGMVYSEKLEFIRLWDGDLKERFRALSMVIEKLDVNEKASYIKDTRV